MMKVVEPYTKIVDGVKELHLQLDQAYEKALKLHDELLGKSENTENRNCIKILVDFRESQCVEKIEGYFYIENTICRFLPIEFDAALLFPADNHNCEDKESNPGISFAQITEYRKNKDVITFRFMRRLDLNTPIYNISGKSLSKSDSSLKKIKDDIGIKFSKISDIESLALLDIPDEYLSRKYTLVGTQYYAPYTTLEKKYCVLFAELDNEYDNNAIKVLRWIPTQKTMLADKDSGVVLQGGDYFFQLGHIARSENSDLHAFMTKNRSRILFGKIEDNNISIIGGIKMFQCNNVKYPKCLYNIPIK